MEHAVLRLDRARSWFYAAMAGSAAYIAFQCLFQFTFGRNTYGWPRYPDGELTGPFGRPRAGPPLARLLMPAILPPVAASLSRRRLRWTLAGIGLLIGGMAVVVLIGQRMPLLVAVGSLLVAGVLMRQLRVPVMIAAVMTALLLAASRSSRPTPIIAWW